MKLYKLTDESKTHYRASWRCWLRWAIAQWRKRRVKLEAGEREPGAIQHPVRSCCVCGQTYRQTQWGEGVEHTAPGTGKLCGAGWIHAYTDLPVLARAALAETPKGREDSMSETKPTARAMRAASVLDEVFIGHRIPGWNCDEVAGYIDQAAGLPALEQCRAVLEDYVNDHMNLVWDESEHKIRVCGCDLCIEARAALAEASEGRAG